MEFIFEKLILQLDKTRKIIFSMFKKLVKLFAICIWGKVKLPSFVLLKLKLFSEGEEHIHGKLASF